MGVVNSRLYAGDWGIGSISEAPTIAALPFLEKPTFVISGLRAAGVTKCATSREIESRREDGDRIADG
jgi:hypothetical protein